MDNLEFIANQYPETELSALERTYDYIVVGAGTAGCVMANRLSENPNMKVLLIEAGGIETRAMDIPGLAGAFQDTEGILDKDVLPEPFDPIEIDWGYFTEPSDTFADGLIDNSVLYPRGKVMGGSSTINYMIYTRGNPEDYNRWGYNWTFNDCHKYFKKAEDYQVDDPSEINNYFGKNGPMHIESPSYRSEFSSAIIKANEQFGYKQININGPNQIGVSRLQRTIKNGYRFSTNSAYLISVRDKRPNLHLRRHSLVTRILISKLQKIPRAYGVVFHSELTTHTIYAKREVIICAGAINSPQLLMLSGIGPMEHLNELGIPVIKNLPVGDNLQDHIYTGGLQFLLNQTVYPITDFGLWLTDRSGPLSLPALIETYGFSQPIDKIQSIEQLYITAAMQLKSAQTMNMKPSVFETTYAPFQLDPGFLIFSLLQKPKSRGYLRLRGCDPTLKPKIYPQYFSHPDDLEIMLNGVKEAINITKQDALQKFGAKLLPIPIPTCAQHTFKSDNYWRCHIKSLVATLFHYCGTCKMGDKSDPTTVVDPHLRVHGIDGLRVCDASIMPEIIAGHLNVPTMMIAEKCADDIKETWF
ncbi:4-pyridoxate dehydrogenase-like [Chrysoperla carnea]|uniref:4-pyridoxate dehydrogenase-like n=1 Tax=Chrysoperla carnea TaxID=189513 RepID=UPI001D098E32|nr:4-pyridoxate dehydrogenase-like [Chrysoperla carnea]